MASIKKDFIEFGRGKDKKKRKKRRETVLTASIGVGAGIGGLQGFVRGRGGLGGKSTFAKRYFEASNERSRRSMTKERINEVVDSVERMTKKWEPSTLKKVSAELNQRGLKRGVKHAAIGASLGATVYGSYRAIKALKNRKKKEND